MIKQKSYFRVEYQNELLFRNNGKEVKNAYTTIVHFDVAADGRESEEVQIMQTSKLFSNLLIRNVIYL